MPAPRHCITLAHRRSYFLAATRAASATAARITPLVITMPSVVSLTTPLTFTGDPDMRTPARPASASPNTYARWCVA